MTAEPNLAETWSRLLRQFPVLAGGAPDAAAAPDPRLAADIRRLRLADAVQALVFACVEEQLRRRVAPAFWAHFAGAGAPGEFARFPRAVDALHAHFARYAALLAAVGALAPARRPAGEALRLAVKAAVFSQLVLGHQTTIRGFYELVLRLKDPEFGTAPAECCLICAMGADGCSCIRLFFETNRKLEEMNLLEPLVGQILTNLIYSYVETHIQKICKDNFDTPLIVPLEKWLATVVIPWLEDIYSSNETNKKSLTFMRELTKKLANYVNNTYTRTRIDQLFNIIIEYPDSLPALEDLHACLPKTDLKAHLIGSLQRSMRTRLLHPGVSTSDVLTAYIAAIKSLRVLDPSGLLLETITLPVHRYLKSREDTVRCVVSSLTEEGPNDLAEELIRGETIEMDETTTTDIENWRSWVPDPLFNKASTQPRTSDIISMLVNVYGSKELFVNEYRTLLANRLLSQFLCDTEKEIRYLELLKLRFGESQLHYCEVMLKDIADSKRINQNIEMDPSYVREEIPVTALILSAQFWPPFKEEKLELHQRVVGPMENYTDDFETLKGSRTLSWLNHLGCVELEVELADRTLCLSVAPVHATILMHFEDCKTWTLESLSKIMHVPSTTLKKKMQFWQSHGVILESEPDVFELQEEQEFSKSNLLDDILVEDSESESAMASAQDQREDELQTFWSYITGMLMNLDTLPLERIHQMLKMFAFQGPTIECNLQELKFFLDRKVREHQLIFSNGLYRLPK